MKGVEREISVARRIVIGVGVGGTECGESILRGRRAKGHVVVWWERRLKIVLSGIDVVICESRTCLEGGGFGKDGERGDIGWMLGLQWDWMGDVRGCIGRS